MAATTTPKISSVFSRLQKDFSDIAFVAGVDFQWSPDTSTITHPPITTREELSQLLHEVSHALLGHLSYPSDIALIDMERQAWQHAIEQLAPRYGLRLGVEDDIVQNTLDSYRLWLSARSTCPECSSIGQGLNKSNYRCLACGQSWRVNEARTCRLKRYKT